jgi:flagellar hook-basal body protein
MLKSLYSGVSGLQSHQIAMDVESNNIANVNTTGFKYSRANFSNILAQTSSIATAPQGQLGGKNPVQVGLGATVNSTTTIYSQGSIQNTDKNTDVAIQGDGFFIVSPDGGNTYKYTRAGDFKFDANGNFVDNNGNITQGWLKDPVTGKVDSTAPIENINISPGLTTPAQPTREVVLKANLNSGATVESFSPAYKVSDDGVVEDDGNGNSTEVSGDLGVLFNENGEAFSLQDGQGVNISFDGGDNTYSYTYSSDTNDVKTDAGDDKVFHTMADLRKAMDNEASDYTGTDVQVVVDGQGKFAISNPDDSGKDLNIQVTAYTDSDTTENVKFTRNMEAMNAVLPAGSDGVALTQGFEAATHSSSIDIFDSLGSKHTLRTEFRKTALDTTTGSTWDMKLSVPEPATIDTVAPKNEKKGSIRFNNDGSLATYNPPNVSFSGNNGSAPDQQVNLSFGTANDFDGMTSFDSRSATSGISQDGFTGGDLVGIRIDQSGTLIGSFSNGRSFGLAQIGMAKFTNKEGLSTEGGNIYNQTANSGDPIIGTAATAGRGFIQASSLEASNVDLSKSLTNLIIIQRGYEANGKTITTSDEMLQTLLGLKR